MRLLLRPFVWLNWRRSLTDSNGPLCSEACPLLSLVRGGYSLLQQAMSSTLCSKTVVWKFALYRVLDALMVQEINKFTHTGNYWLRRWIATEPSDWSTNTIFTAQIYQRWLTWALVSQSLRHPHHRNRPRLPTTNTKYQELEETSLVLLKNVLYRKK